MRRVGCQGVRQRPPAGRERFLQSLLSAKGARRRPRERSSAGASGGLLPAGSGKADAVWSSTRQTATTSHNFILESRPAAAPARAGGRAGGGEENRRIQVRLGRPGAAFPRVVSPHSSPPSSGPVAGPGLPGRPPPSFQDFRWLPLPGEPRVQQAPRPDRSLPPLPPRDQFLEHGRCPRR